MCSKSLGPYTSEASGAIALLAVSLPFIVCGGAWQGVLEGHLGFDLSNLVRIPLSTLNYLVPLAILPFAADLVWIVGGTDLARRDSSLLRARAPGHRGPAGAEASARGFFVPCSCLRLGWRPGVAAVIIYLGRFSIGALLTMSALAFYVTPFEIVSRLTLIPGAVGGALLPAFASTRPGRAARDATATSGAACYVVLLVFPAAMLVVLFAREG